MIDDIHFFSFSEPRPSTAGEAALPITSRFSAYPMKTAAAQKQRNGNTISAGEGVGAQRRRDRSRRTELSSAAEAKVATDTATDQPAAVAADVAADAAYDATDTDTDSTDTDTDQPANVAANRKAAADAAANKSLAKAPLKSNCKRIPIASVAGVSRTAPKPVAVRADHDRPPSTGVTARLVPRDSKTRGQQTPRKAAAAATPTRARATQKLKARGLGKRSRCQGPRAATDDDPTMARASRVDLGKESGSARLANRTGIMAMSRNAFRASLQKACYQIFGRLQVRTGEKKAAAIVARTQRGAKAGSKAVPVSKHPCYIVQRCISSASTSRSRFQITMDQSAGAKVGLHQDKSTARAFHRRIHPFGGMSQACRSYCASGRR